MTDTDVRVFDAAFAAFLADPEADTFVFDPKPSGTTAPATAPAAPRSQIVVHNESSKTTGMIDPEQLSADVDKLKLPEDAVQDMRGRNRAAAVATDALAGVAAGNVIVGDLDKLPRGMFQFDDAFAKAYPRARGFAHVWLPGYSEDGSQALVRFSFGPTPHGATATYLLRRNADGKSWTVVVKKLAYYV